MNWVVEEANLSSSVSEYVYETLRKSIIRLNLKPGERISENEVSKLLKVSRTPVREAFIKLSREDLLYVLPQRGTCISYIDLEQIEEIRFIRESLEKSVIGMATIDFPDLYLVELELNIISQREAIDKKAYAEFLELDEKFHKIIFTGCGKEGIWTRISYSNSQYQRIRILTFIADINWKKALKQHEEIVGAIKNKDEVKAQMIIGEHIQKIRDEQLELKNKYPEFFK